MTAIVTLIWTAVALSVAFAALFYWARHLDNFGIVDVAWSGAFAPVALWYSMVGDAPMIRSLALVIAVAAWSLRLAAHLGRRVAAHHPTEDGRYAQLRRDWARRLDFKMGCFFQMQAVSIVVLSWPFLAISRNAAPGWSLVETIGAFIVLAGLSGETIADLQLAAFKRGQTAPGAVCDRGLWRYSRHPNYFFEWLVWVGFAVWAWPAPGGWAGVASPAIMLYLLLRVTGVRATDEQLTRSRGEAFLRYRETTSAFVPWFPRRASTRRNH